MLKMAAIMGHEFEVKSRFSVLAKDDSDSGEEETAKRSKDEESKKKAKNAKKRARKKKKAAAETAEAKELRDMAFGGKPKHVHHTNAPKTQPHLDEKPPAHSDNNTEWSARDEQFVLNQFQVDLEEALKRSADEENQKLLERAAETGASKKKSKDHTVKLSLDEFHVKSTETVTHSQSQGTNGLIDSTSQPTEKPLKKHKKKKEKHQNIQLAHTEEILKGAQDAPKVNDAQSARTLDPASISQWMNELEKKDKENEKLRDTIKELKDELVEVKKRNKQLCFILGQGEMRDKSDILQQIDVLTNVKDELSSELSEMHSLLEQERSKVSFLKIELAKSQTGRAKKPSFSENGHR